MDQSTLTKICRCSLVNSQMSFRRLYHHSNVSLSTFHPDGNARNQYGERQQQDRDIGYEPALGLRHRQTAVLRILWPDRDEALILSEPGYGVEKEIPITLRAEEAIRREVRITDDNHAGFFVVAQILCNRRCQ